MHFTNAYVFELLLNSQYKGHKMGLWSFQEEQMEGLELKLETEWQKELKRAGESYLLCPGDERLCIDLLL